MKVSVYIILLQIDLGDQVVSVHSTQELAEEALTSAAAAFRAKHGFDAVMTIESHLVDAQPDHTKI